MKVPFIGTALNVFARRLEASLLHAVMTELGMTIEGPAKQEPNHVRSTDQQDRVINTLMRSYDQGRIPRDAIVGNCLAILIAGYDTTSTTLAYLGPGEARSCSRQAQTGVSRPWNSI